MTGLTPKGWMAGLTAESSGSRMDEVRGESSLLLVLGCSELSYGSAVSRFGYLPDRSQLKRLSVGAMAEFDVAPFGRRMGMGVERYLIRLGQRVAQISAGMDAQILGEPIAVGLVGVWD